MTSLSLHDPDARLHHYRERIAALDHGDDRAFRDALRLLARVARRYDQETGRHIQRVNEYSGLLAERHGLPSTFCAEIRVNAQLHDIGKLVVDPAILRKQGELTADERRQMDQHPIYGFELLRCSRRLAMGAEIALNHHEKWDGSGYPRGVAGAAIPISAAIVQLADIYDALRSARAYKPALDHEQARLIILEGDDRIDPASQFAPAILALFERHHAALDSVWRRLAD